MIMSLSSSMSALRATHGARDPSSVFWGVALIGKGEERWPLLAAASGRATWALRLFRRHAEQRAGIRILEHPERAVRTDFDVADAVSDAPALCGSRAAFAVERDTVQRL